jgi:hypothetical protein
MPAPVRGVVRGNVAQGAQQAFAFQHAVHVVFNAQAAFQLIQRFFI